MALVDVRSRRIVKANAALERLLDHPQGQLEGCALRDLDTRSPDEVEAHLLLALACGDHRPQRRTWVGASGRSVPVEVLAARLDGDHGTMLALYVRDTRPGATDFDAAKEAGADGDGTALSLWIAQKHESLGRLATGFAQELEGILGRVVGSAEALQAGSPSAAAAHAGLGEILGATREARSLVRELLAYAGRQSLVVRTIGLNEVVADAEAALWEALPSDIGLLLRPCAGPARVSADPERLKEVLIHLVKHAGDSMPDGGYVVVATE
jgi:signal transduction histidine kinase